MGIFVATVVLVALSWWWRGMPAPMPHNVLPAGEKLHCVSYAPFRGSQTPLDPTTIIPPAQIEADLAQLSRTTSCVRIYSVDMGLDRVPEIAARHQMQVLLGIWISGEARRNREQISIGLALAQRYPETIRAIVVGNEVLLRGEQSAAGLKAIIEQVKDQTKIPVTYADVWEFWLQNRQLNTAVDFVTVHILPYWEDLPIAADQAAAHIASIRARVGQEFPGKDVLIGEAGWPSQGRMREGARPSPIDQARVLHDLLSLAQAERFKVNLIEAYDQPWKRHLEGTVGGYWGIFDNDHVQKFAWGAPVSNAPFWRWQLLGGLTIAAIVFAIGLVMRNKHNRHTSNAGLLSSLGVVATCAGCLAPSTVEASLVEGLGAIGGARSTLQALVAVLVPLVAAAALGAGSGLPALEQVIGLRDRRRTDLLSRLLALSTAAVAIVAVEAALGLVFNARYLDFPYAALTSATVPLLVLSLRTRSPIAWPPAAETVIAIILAVSPIKIMGTETFANWQAAWACAAFLLFSVTLARVRSAPG